MKSSLFILVILFAALSVNSQSKNFLEVFNNLPVKIECNLGDETQKRILFEYGAVYISEAAAPPKCLFNNQRGIDTFLTKKLSCFRNFGAGTFCLQTKAKDSLEKVFKLLKGYRNVARNDNNTTTVTDGINDDWALRKYEQAKDNWNKNLPKRLRGKTISDILKIDDGTQHYMFSYAIPGGSQHHLGLAIDVNSQGRRKCNEKCENALKANGWYRTIPFDPYHFTYLGFTKKEQLQSRGLKQVRCSNEKYTDKAGKKINFSYWVPNLSVGDYAVYKFTKENCEDVQ